MSKKSFPLRIEQELFDSLKRWADHDMRSINGQIEYLLREAVQRRARQAPNASPSDYLPTTGTDEDIRIDGD